MQNVFLEYPSICRGFEILMPMLHMHLQRSIGIVGTDPDACPAARGGPNISVLEFDKKLSDYTQGPIVAFVHNFSDFLPPGAEWRQAYDLEPIDFHHIVDDMRGNYYVDHRYNDI
jgi:hypothetical protein